MPQEQQSGTGTALDVDAILQPTEVVNFEENKWFVDAGVRTTTWAGLDFILEEKPDLVISGINEGENIGAGGAVSSGTVSAAVTAILRDISAIAVSAGIDLEDEERTRTLAAYTIGANFVTDLIAQLQATQGDEVTLLPAETGLSINIPADDSFFVTNGGNNIITGGAGTDRFWIANAQIPQSANTITDFTIGEDIIGIAGLGIAFADLNLIQNEANTLISADGNNLAILSGVETDSLSANNFVFV
ncbi:MAG: 5'/3'-nucleotidase SurE [Xenococcaceae cyanobacterium]